MAEQLTLNQLVVGSSPTGVISPTEHRSCEGCGALNSLPTHPDILQLSNDKHKSHPRRQVASLRLDPTRTRT